MTQDCYVFLKKTHDEFKHDRTNGDAIKKHIHPRPF